MRYLCCALFVILFLASCRDKVICAAFQSTYILDDSVRNTYFSYAWYLNENERNATPIEEPELLPPDSLGVMVASSGQDTGVDYFAYTEEYKVMPRTPKRTKYGIVKRAPVIPNLVKNFQLKTSPMENVFSPPTVKIEEETDESIPLDSSALAPLDSTAIVVVEDSLNVSQPIDSLVVGKMETAEVKTKPWEQFKYGFNPHDSMQPDQEYYFRKYGWLLQNSPPREEPIDSTQVQQNGLDSLSSDSTAQRKGIKGLFKKNRDRTKKVKRKKEDEVENESPIENFSDENQEGTKPEEDEGDGINEGGF